MEVSREFHAPATLPLGKNPDTSWTGGWVGTRAGLHGFGEENVCCTCKDSNPGPSSRLRCPGDVALIKTMF